MISRLKVFNFQHSGSGLRLCVEKLQRMDGVSSSEGSQHPPLLQQGDRFSETKIFVTDTNTLKKSYKRLDTATR